MNAVYSAFFSGLAKEAGVGTNILESGKEGLRMTRDLFNPRTSLQTIRDAYAESANTSPNARAALHDELGPRFFGAKRRLGYVDDILSNKSTTGALRRGGWLANVARYEGKSLPRKVLNRIGRALPGQRAMGIGFGAMQLASDIKERDPMTGRRRGMFERALGGGLGFAGGIAASSSRFSRNGLVGQLVGPMLVSSLASGVGTRGGRLLDRLAGTAPKQEEGS